MGTLPSRYKGLSMIWPHVQGMRTVMKHKVSSAGNLRWKCFSNTNDVALVLQASANEPRGGTSDAGSLIDLELAPSAPAGAVSSAFPEASPAANTAAARSPGAPSPGRSITLLGEDPCVLLRRGQLGAS